MSCWIRLGIAPTQDQDAIRLAYRTLLPQHHPETDPQGFQALRAAYEAALRQARTPPQAEPPPGTAADPMEQLLEDFQALLDDPSRRFSSPAWQAFIARLEPIPLELLEPLGWELLGYLLDSGPLSHACARLLARRLGWAGQLLQLEFDSAQRADQFLQRIEQDDPFDLDLMASWSPAAQLETLWYARTLEHLYQNRPLHEFAAFAATHTCLPLPHDEAYLQRLLVQFSQAGIGSPCLHELCVERLRQAPQDADWRYLLACQSSALGLDEQALPHWLQLWQQHRHPRAAAWLLDWCARHEPQRLPLLIQAFDLQDGYRQWPADLADDSQAYGSPAQRPETLARWTRAARSGLDGLAAAFVQWRLDDDELPLLAWLLGDAGDHLLARLYRHAWVLQRGDSDLLRQVLDEQGQDNALDVLIVDSFKAQAEQQLHWLQQAPALLALQDFLASPSPQTEPHPALAAPGEARDLCLLWLRRLRPYPAQALQRLDQAFALHKQSAPLHGLHLLQQLAERGRTLPAPEPGAALWQWHRQTLLLLALLEQPQRCLELLPGELLDSLPVEPAHPLHDLQRLLLRLRRQQGDHAGLLAWLDRADPVQQLVARRLFQVQQALDASCLLSNDRLFGCYQDNFAAFDNDPLGLLLLCAVLYHDPLLNAEQHGVVLQEIAAFTSAGAWFETFRDGLIRGRPLHPPREILRNAGIAAEPCYAALDTLAGLIRYGSAGVPRSGVLKRLQQAKDDSANPLGLRLAMSALLSWCERLLLAKATAKPAAPWAFWRLGSRLGRAGFALCSISSLLLASGLAISLVAGAENIGLACAILLLELVALLGMSLRRLHDAGHGVGMLLLYLGLTLVLPLTPLALFFVSGDPLPNRYGMPPGSAGQGALPGGLQAVLRGLNGWRPPA